MTDARHNRIALHVKPAARTAERQIEAQSLKLRRGGGNYPHRDTEVRTDVDTRRDETYGPQRLRHESSDYRGPAVVIEKSPPPSRISLSLSLFGKVMTRTADKTNTTDTRSTCNL